jgi:hypothetical protein
MTLNGKSERIWDKKHQKWIDVVHVDPSPKERARMDKRQPFKIDWVKLTAAIVGFGRRTSSTYGTTVPTLRNIESSSSCGVGSCVECDGQTSPDRNALPRLSLPFAARRALGGDPLRDNRYRVRQRVNYGAPNLETLRKNACVYGLRDGLRRSARHLDRAKRRPPREEA